MTITVATADALDALGLAIFNPNIVPNDAAHAGLGAHFDPAAFTGIRGQDDAIDAQYYALIAPVMLAIDGRTMAPGFKYTLNITNALQGRALHWYMQGLYEFVPGDIPPVSVGFMHYHGAGEPPQVGDVGHYGFTLATALCGGICIVWAEIIRRWLNGNYPFAVSLP